MNSINLMRSLCLVLLIVSKSTFGQSVTKLQDLSSFQPTSSSWKVVSDVRADIDKVTFETSEGSGIIVNTPSKKNRGKDLVSNLQHGDVDVELDYMMAKGSNSGIYLQGRYEVQLVDSWGIQVPRAGDNGGIAERWDEGNSAGRKGYQGYAPRQNVSRAPGLWQHLKISFRSPRFDVSGKKIENAKMLLVKLNGVVVHENVELFGPTHSSIGQEGPLGPLRVQGDAGAIAFRNITVKPTEDRPESTLNGAKSNGETGEVNHEADGERETRLPPNPVPVRADHNTLLRSFMDLPGGHRVVRAVSLGHPSKVHYTYDMDNGSLVHLWRGEFLDATPMWHSRGDGSSRPAGSVLNLGRLMPSVARLATPQSQWIADTTGTGFRQRGYTLSTNEEPTFRYETFGATVNDAVRVIDQGHGIQRTITIENAAGNFYVRIAGGKSIEHLSGDLYLIDDKSYYLRLEDAGSLKPLVRDANGEKEMIVPIRSKIIYSILF